MRRLCIAGLVVAAFCLWDAPIGRAGADENPKQPEVTLAAGPGKLVVTVGKSLIIDSPTKIQRISVANGELIEAVAVNPKEVLINGKAAGETSLIVWQEGGNRLLYDLTVRMSPLKLDAVRQQLARDFPNEDINVTYENDTAFVRGTVKDVIAADRAMSIAASLGKTVNLLRVEVPPVEQQMVRPEAASVHWLLIRSLFAVIGMILSGADVVVDMEPSCLPAPRGFWDTALVYTPLPSMARPRQAAVAAE